MRLGFRTEDPDKKIVDKTPVEPVRLGYTTISPFSFYDSLQWTKIFKRMRNPVSLLKVGDEKVTLGLPWEKSKLYVLPLFLKALSQLELNDDAEFYFTIDASPAPERWSKQGRSKSGMRARREHVADCHNRCRERALDNGSDYLWIVETDLLPTPDAYRRLRTLIVKHRADVAVLPYTWHYVSNEGPLNPKIPLLGWRGKVPRLTSIKFSDFLLESYPAQLTTGGFGCTMFTRKVFEKPFELDNSYWCTDGVLAKRVEKENFKVLADNRMFVQHVCCRSCFKKGYGEYREDWNVQEEINKTLKDRNVKVNVVNEDETRVSN